MIKTKKCDECLKWFNRLHVFKGKYICYRCMQKQDSVRALNSLNSLINPKNTSIVPLDRALAKEYIVKSYRYAHPSPSCMISLPSCFEGKIVKLTIVGEQEKIRNVELSKEVRELIKLKRIVEREKKNKENGY